MNSDYLTNSINLNSLTDKTPIMQKESSKPCGTDRARSQKTRSGLFNSCLSQSSQSFVNFRKSASHFRTFSRILTYESENCGKSKTTNKKGWSYGSVGMMLFFQYFLRPDFFAGKNSVVHSLKNWWQGLTSSGNELCSSFPEEVGACQAEWILQGKNCLARSLKKSGIVRPSDFFRERTAWFVPWRSHGKAWYGLTSSGNELCSSFPEEVRPCQSMSFKCHEFFRKWTTQIFPWKSQAWRNVGSLFILASQP